MGKGPHNKSGGQKKKYSHKTARRAKFLKKGDDAIFDEVQKHALADAAMAETDMGAAAAAVAAGGAVGSSRSNAASGAAVLDEDLPGMGQWYCLFCDRHFSSEAVRTEHNRTKMHRKRVKAMKSGPKPHSQLDAELAAGMGAPDNGKHSGRSKQAVAAAGPSSMVIS